MIIVDDVEGDGEREENSKNGDGEEIAVEEEVENDKNDEFSKNTEDSPSEAVGKEALEKAERVMLRMWG